MARYFLLMFSVILQSVLNQSRDIKENDWVSYTPVLPRVIPHRIGEIRRLKLVPWKTHEMRTLNLEPPVFEITDFLTESECNYLIDQAEREGLSASRIVGEKPDASSDSSASLTTFTHWDLNVDGKISRDEAEIVFQRAFGAELINCTLETLGLDFDNDGFVLESEFHARNQTKLQKFIHDIQMETRKKVRHSDQAWIRRSVESKNPVMASIEKRIAKLTGLPLKMVQSTEEMQVVKYRPGGHYNCHLDSDLVPKEKKRMPCCHIDSTGECNICRYITILYYLNEVEEGGQTAFPIAGSLANETVWVKNSSDLCDLTQNCHLANLIVSPRRGKVIFWYNHYRDHKTQWMGVIDNLSFHGGCQVIKGVKWIANHWIDASYKRKNDERHWESFFAS